MLNKNGPDGKDTTLTRITEKETFEFFSEGLRQSASAASQLAELQKHAIWEDISTLLMQLHNNGIEMYKSKPLARFDVLGMLDKRQTVMSDKLENQRPKKFILN